jgi:hypothetical protein
LLFYQTIYLLQIWLWIEANGLSGILLQWPFCAT